mmetsp:Transcript_19424/g.44659  ORF Transcript_19424/g.44659 Transcript_19424/m.44659 type:complete len:230 (+) Transcript_19424:2738-3427(+)
MPLAVRVRATLAQARVRYVLVLMPVLLDGLVLDRVQKLLVVLPHLRETPLAILLQHLHVRIFDIQIRLQIGRQTLCVFDLVDSRMRSLLLLLRGRRLGLRAHPLRRLLASALGAFLAAALGVAHELGGVFLLHLARRSLVLAALLLAVETRRTIARLLAAQPQAHAREFGLEHGRRRRRHSIRPARWYRQSGLHVLAAALFSLAPLAGLLLLLRVPIRHVPIRRAWAEA